MKISQILLTLLAMHTDYYVWGIDYCYWNNLQRSVQSKQIFPLSPLTVETITKNLVYTINLSILPHSFAVKDFDFEVSIGPLNLNLVASDTFVTGLDTIVAQISIDNDHKQFTIGLKSPEVIRVSGEYKANRFYLNPVKVKKSVHGNGNYSISIKGLEVEYKAEIMNSEKLQIEYSSMNLNFDFAEVFAENFTINGSLLDWSKVNDILNRHFESIWSRFHEQIGTKLARYGNTALMNYTLDQILAKMNAATKGWLYFKLLLIRICPICSAFINSLQVFSYKIPG